MFLGACSMEMLTGPSLCHCADSAQEKATTATDRKRAWRFLRMRAAAGILKLAGGNDGLQDSVEGLCGKALLRRFLQMPKQVVLVAERYRGTMFVSNQDPLRTSSGDGTADSIRSCFN